MLTRIQILIALGNVITWAAHGLLVHWYKATGSQGAILVLLAEIGKLLVNLSLYVWSERGRFG